MNPSDARWTVVFDTERCNGCSNCVIATMDEYVDNEHPGYTAPMPRHGHKWLDLECHERGSFPAVDVAYLARMCQHCEDPPCAKPVPGAVRKRADGIVVFDPQRAVGAKAIVDACPYGAIHWNETLQLPQHWNMDAHLLDAGWTDTRATQACPTGALTLRKLTDAQLQTARQQEGLAELRPDLGSRPRVFYRHLHRVQSLFIAGTVLRRAASGQGFDAVMDANIRLLATASGEVHETRTNAFGDFRLDGLPVDIGSCSLRIESDGAVIQAAEMVLHTSRHVGDFIFDSH